MDYPATDNGTAWGQLSSREERAHLDARGDRTQGRQEDNRGPASGFIHADRGDGIIPTVANRPGAHGLMPLRLQMLGCRRINVLCFSAGYSRTAAATLTGED